MDPEKKTKFDQLIMRQRIRDFAPAVALCIVLLAVYFFLFDQSVSERTTISATVRSWSISHRDKGHNTYELWVDLPDGSNVWATAPTNTRIPSRGEIIQIEKTKSDLGRVSYSWNR